MKETKADTRVTQKSLFYWVFAGNFKLQIVLLLVIVLIVFARVVPLEMQKRIINDSIALKNLDGLVVYSLIYIAAITAASALKLAINYLQAIIGEQAMNLMRKELYQHILSLPLGFFRNTQPGMVVASLMTELSTAGTFAGLAFAVPITNILTLLAFAGYLLWLNTKLATATLLIYPIVVFVVPILQKRANKANKKRVDLSRSTSSQIAETISGINEVQVHGAYAEENKKFGDLTDQLKKIRIRWSLFRFAIKTANNYFVGLGPFIVFIFGGYLVMNGQLALGAMVAFLSAQEKLFDPWKELIDFYQAYQDASVRYTRTMGYFDAVPEFPLLSDVSLPTNISGGVEVHDLFFKTSDGHKLLNGMTFSLKSGEHLAVVGFSGSGKSTLIQCIGKMYTYTGGSIKIDGVELSTLSKKEVIQNIGYVSQNPFIFTSTIQDNLLYAKRAMSPDPKKQKESEVIDLDRMILVLQQVGLFVDVMRFGLDTIIDTSDKNSMDTIIRIRTKLRENFGAKLEKSVEFYTLESYHHNSSIGGNIIFGSSTNPNFGPHLLPENENFLIFLKQEKLLQPLLQLGVVLAREAVDLFSGLDSMDLFFEKSPVPSKSLDACEQIITTLKSKEIEHLSKTDKTLLLSIALKFTPGLHSMTSLPAELKIQILQARHRFPGWCDNVAPGLFNFYNETSYLPNQSILNNIFFGKIRPGLPGAQELINRSITHLLIEEDYLETVAKIGMEFHVGTMGDKLSGGQRQKLAIARVLLKQPKIILMDEATSALDNKSQTRIQRLMTTRWKNKRTVIAVVHRLDIIEDFDKVAVTKAGKIIEFGSYQDLISQKGALHELIYGRQ
ncbi:MAG: ABC-type bacteriocin/lantibiotic exporter with double-glycine peptidase domain [Desulforhopalus sp.]|jgi:ABC-type bacteriocin/lantibiotic exporter with double-glycine peptidase domain